jgi:hypothetical protein
MSLKPSSVETRNWSLRFERKTARFAVYAAMTMTQKIETARVNTFPPRVDGDQTLAPHTRQKPR